VSCGRDSRERHPWRRLFQEIAAAPTRAEAQAVLEAADWILVDMAAAEREAFYADIADVIAEKP
jgi:hypothetical protein